MQPDDEDQRKKAEERKRDEEYNRTKRAELIEKHKRNPYIDEYERGRKKSDAKELEETQRTEKLAIKEYIRKKSTDSSDSKLPYFSVRRKPNNLSDSSIAPDLFGRPTNPTTYYPHEGVRRSIVEDISKGGSRRATEPLKAQLLEIIQNMSPNSRFVEEKINPALKAERPRKDSILQQDDEMPSTSWGPLGSPRRLSPVENQITTSNQSNAQTPNKSKFQKFFQREQQPTRDVPASTSYPPQYPIYESTDVSSALTHTESERKPDSQMASSVASNTIRLPSTSSAMREGRTADYLNEGWYHNVFYRDTNDEFSSLLCSSARQMAIPPYIQQEQNVQNLELMAASGPILCDRCRYNNDVATRPSHTCCPGMTQSLAQMNPSTQPPTRSGTVVQCNNTCPTRNSILQTIYNAFKNPLQRFSHTRTLDPNIPELYRLNISEGNDCQPKRVIFDKIDGDIYRPQMANVGTNTQVGIGHSPLITQMGIVQPGGCTKVLFPQQSQDAYIDQCSEYNHGSIIINHLPGGADTQPPKPNQLLKQNLHRHQERIDVYYFDHGNASYYRTTDSPGTVYTEMIAERTEHSSSQYWAELFGTIHIAFSLFTAFFLQLYRFVLHSTCRPLIVGFVQLTSDYLLKPVLALLFNAILQPILIYFYNIATSFRDLCEPIADGIGFFLREIAVPIRAFRLVEVKQYKTLRPYTQVL